MSSIPKKALPIQVKRHQNSFNACRRPALDALEAVQKTASNCSLFFYNSEEKCSGVVFSFFGDPKTSEKLLRTLTNLVDLQDVTADVMDDPIPGVRYFA